MKFFVFGERVSGYEIPVLNEREARAAAGILFVFAMIAFMHAWILGNFFYIKVYVIGFLIDFAIRMIINPLFSPTMILGRLVTQNQKVEYVGAPQKRFAWAIGLAMSFVMFWMVVVFNVRGPINLLFCLTCLTFLFFESAFGICIGCYLYSLITKKKAKLCPGGVCELHRKEEIQQVHVRHWLVLVGFVVMLGLVFTGISAREKKMREVSMNSKETDCGVPDWAMKMGHEDMYKRHHGCE